MGRTAQPYIATLNELQPQKTHRALNCHRNSRRLKLVYILHKRLKEKKLSGLTSSEQTPTPPL